jgi:hypothetical protein
MILEDIQIAKFHELPKDEALKVILSIRANRIAPRIKPVKTGNGSKTKAVRKESELNLKAALTSMDDKAAFDLLKDLLKRRKTNEAS